MDKQSIRKKILLRLKQQNEKQRLKKSLAIEEQLFLKPQFIQADTIMFYIAKDGEVETSQMIRETLKMGKKVIVPITMVKEKKIIPSRLENFDTELEKGPYGIYQPKREFMRRVMLKSIDLTVVPGLAFDAEGNRLGRGCGYFDRFLAKLAERDIPTCGIAFKFQMIEKLPMLSHDIPVSMVLCA